MSEDEKLRRDSAEQTTRRVADCWKSDVACSRRSVDTANCARAVFVAAFFGGVKWLHWPCTQKSGRSPQPTNARTARKARSFRRTEFVGRASLLRCPRTFVLSARTYPSVAVEPEGDGLVFV